jgi:hypothetical protein
MKLNVAFFRKKDLARAQKRDRTPSKEMYLVFDLLGAYLGAGAFSKEEVKKDDKHRFFLM